MTTDPQRQAFLDMIIAEPHEDVHRLVYADWIDERGEGERAALIRWMVDNPDGHFQPLRDSVEMAFLGVRSDVRRHWRLLDDHRHIWWTAGYDLFLNSAWHRGFCNIVEWGWPDWNTHADTITRQHPIEEVRLLTWPELERMSHLLGKSEYWLKDRPRQSVERDHHLYHLETKLSIELLNLIWPMIKFTLAAIPVDSPPMQYYPP